MFQLSVEEWQFLRLQIETSKRGGRRYIPYAFTEQGVAIFSCKFVYKKRSHRASLDESRDLLCEVLSFY